MRSFVDVKAEYGAVRPPDSRTLFAALDAKVSSEPTGAFSPSFRENK